MNDAFAHQLLRQRAENPCKIQKLPSRYANTYASLLKLASYLEDHSNTEDLLMLGCAVYAWMPTTLKKWNFLEFDLGKISVEVLRSCDRYDDAACLVREKIPEPLLNNSWVGTSKFLHFINPEMFPIWDSKVAMRFGLQGYQMKKKKHYLGYMNFCRRQALLIGNDLETAASYLSFQAERRSSIMRTIELLLFLDEATPSSSYIDTTYK